MIFICIGMTSWIMCSIRGSTIVIYILRIKQSAITSALCILYCINSSCIMWGISHKESPIWCFVSTICAIR